MLKSVAVFGASGGIGKALVQQLCNAHDTDIVYAIARNTDKVPPHPKIELIECDITDALSVAAATDLIPINTLDLVFVATGVLSSEAGTPEKRLVSLNTDYALEQFSVNTLGPMLVAQHVLPKLDRKKRTYFAALSARVGSISDNRLGGWYSYRAAKSALNMMIKTAAIEFQRTHPELVITALHPGTVDTNLSKPFQGRVPESRLFSAEQSAAYLLDVLQGLTPSQSGKIFAWDSSLINP